ncbi:uncharacterized protein ColSpa_08279 [Colletotrichum spaethianum]|uniref:2EXR domain-containing protein n=1 Tax=Colletotrichum spaethianum TaxID=700344 RepID=A0AA37P9F5_9PEZI|nr:uncharacterized protein ColSpa_08279 [Colletotrichum spaethianum]GKT48098.1 hypothetical protein ColSpa_08279 [Colletotrichum spaethianum]
MTPNQASETGSDRRPVQKHNNAMERLWNALRDLFVHLGSVNPDLEIPANSFPRFLHFPPEIRRMIWEASLPPGRIYEPKTYNSWITYDTRPVQFYQHWAPPVMREACREAYTVCMENGSFRFGYFGGMRPGLMRGIWFNNDLDAVYLHTYEQWHYFHLLGIKNVCISDTIALDPYQCQHIFGCLSCDRVIIAYYPVGTPAYEQLTKTYPVFRSIRNENEVVAMQQVDPEDLDADLEITWKEHKATLEEYWKKEQHMMSVTFEAVEVFRKARDPSAI